VAGDGGDNDGGCVEMTLDFGGFVRSLELSALLLFGGPEWAAQCPTPARKVQLLFFWMDQGSRVFKGNGDDLARAASAPPAAAAHAVHARKQQRRRPPPPTAATAATPRPRPQRREWAAARLWLRLRLRRMRRRCCFRAWTAWTPCRCRCSDLEMKPHLIAHMSKLVDHL